MAVYDNRQFSNMRNDAIRRSREMYRNSMVNTSHYSQGDNYKENNMPDSEIIQKPEKKEIINENNKNNNINNNYNNKSIIPDSLSKLFEGGFDSDKLTIIALIIILAKEGADMKLILALGYILI
ncbi:MAG: hypothetical protein K2G63_05705 [Oscillospiraceae bacterium]|nr:hypothetical protein [Oscillospiraceae bacterium]